MLTERLAARVIELHDRDKLSQNVVGAVTIFTLKTKATKFTTSQFAFLIQKDAKTASRYCKQLENVGIIIKTGRGKWSFIDGLIRTDLSEEDTYNNIKYNNNNKINKDFQQKTTSKLETLPMMRTDISVEDLERAAGWFGDNPLTPNDLGKIVSEELVKTGMEYSQEVFFAAAKHSAYQYRHPEMRRRAGQNIIPRHKVGGFFRVVYKRMLVRGVAQCVPSTRVGAGFSQAVACGEDISFNYIQAQEDLSNPPVVSNQSKEDTFVSSDTYCTSYDEPRVVETNEVTVSIPGRGQSFIKILEERMAQGLPSELLKSTKTPDLPVNLPPGFFVNHFKSK